MLSRTGSPWKQAVFAQARWDSGSGPSRAVVWLRPSACRRCKSSASGSAPAPAPAPARERERERTPDLTSLYTSISRSERHKKSQEREFLVSVLSSSPTKRDAKKYLQTFGRNQPAAARATAEAANPPPPAGGDYADSIRAVRQSPQFVQEPGPAPAAAADQQRPDPTQDQPHVAIVKLQDPDTIDDATLAGLAKTLVQLRALGLCSVVVLGRSAPLPTETRPGWLDGVTRATLRVAAAIDQYGDRITSLVDAAVALDDRDRDRAHESLHSSPFVPGRVFVDASASLLQSLRRGKMVVLPPTASCPTTSATALVDADDIVLALTRYFAGLPQRLPSSPSPSSPADAQTDFVPPTAVASVDRVIVIDPIGGTPSPRRPNGAHIFLNMAEEYRTAKAAIDDMAARQLLASDGADGAGSAAAVAARHKANLDVLRRTLALLPPSSSALLTTPAEAANLAPHADRGAADAAAAAADGVFGVVGSVGTRRSQNPLIHNLLTDRPVYSSSLPLGRIVQSRTVAAAAASTASRSGGGVESIGHPPVLPQTTLLKRGMPLTIYPDPRTTPWTPPAPGQPRLRLTDACIDLPRLVHLIEDSFNRKLDVQHYLRRVQSSLAGVIVAGAYEGGAILTWERPAGMDAETAYRTGRLVPYLDKFAVLKRSQGAGGVADVVFTAMVRDCFPDGVCWRSRKDNPVNRWYFERSRGSWKLAGVNWAMFWTTPWEAVGEKGIWDYESVCRAVQPSWADQKHILD